MEWLPPPPSISLIYSGVSFNEVKFQLEVSLWEEPVKIDLFRRLEVKMEEHSSKEVCKDQAILAHSVVAEGNYCLFSSAQKHVEGWSLEGPTFS